jgi:hypothetical protein
MSSRCSRLCRRVPASHEATGTTGGRHPPKAWAPTHPDAATCLRHPSQAETGIVATTTAKKGSLNLDRESSSDTVRIASRCQDPFLTSRPRPRCQGAARGRAARQHAVPTGAPRWQRRLSPLYGSKRPPARAAHRGLARATPILAGPSRLQDLLAAATITPDVRSPLAFPCARPQPLPSQRRAALSCRLFQETS